MTADEAKLINPVPIPPDKNFSGKNLITHMISKSSTSFPPFYLPCPEPYREKANTCSMVEVINLTFSFVISL